MSIQPAKHLFGALLLVLSLGGCTTISITDGEGVIRVIREFGMVSIQAAPAAEAVVAEVSALGYLASPMGVSVGWSRQSIALAPDECRVILWVRSASEVAELQQLIGENLSGVCPVVQDHF